MPSVSLVWHRTGISASVAVHAGISTEVELSQVAVPTSENQTATEPTHTQDVFNNSRLGEGVGAPSMPEHKTATEAFMHNQEQSRDSALPMTSVHPTSGPVLDTMSFLAAAAEVSFDVTVCRVS